VTANLTIRSSGAKLTGPNNALDKITQSKQYLKAVLGPSNLIYKQATALKFKRPT
jgi:hypothetical protein